jgi:hypothetical protein
MCSLASYGIQAKFKGSSARVHDMAYWKFAYTRDDAFVYELIVMSCGSVMITFLPEPHCKVQMLDVGVHNAQNNKRYMHPGGTGASFLLLHVCTYVWFLSSVPPGLPMMDNNSLLLLNAPNGAAAQEKLRGVGKVKATIPPPPWWPRAPQVVIAVVLSLCARELSQPQHTRRHAKEERQQRCSVSGRGRRADGEEDEAVAGTER